MTRMSDYSFGSGNLCEVATEQVDSENAEFEKDGI